MFQIGLKPVSSTMAEAGENISVVVSFYQKSLQRQLVPHLSKIIDCSKVRVRNLIERERNSNQSKAFSTEDSTDVVQKSNKKRYV